MWSQSERFRLEGKLDLFGACNIEGDALAVVRRVYISTQFNRGAIFPSNQDPSSDARGDFDGREQSSGGNREGSNVSAAQLSGCGSRAVPVGKVARVGQGHVQGEASGHRVCDGDGTGVERLTVVLNRECEATALTHCKHEILLFIDAHVNLVRVLVLNGCAAVVIVNPSSG